MMLRVKWKIGQTACGECTSWCRPHRRSVARASVILALIAITFGFDYRGLSELNCVHGQDIIDIHLFSGLEQSAFEGKLRLRQNLRLRQISKALNLSDDQVAKLQLAINGDLRRLFREVDQLREQFRDLNGAQAGNRQRNLEMIIPLRTKVRNAAYPSDTGLFDSVLEGTLSEEQQVAYERWRNQRSLQQQEALVRAALSELEKAMPLTSVQRTALLEKVVYLDRPILPQNLRSEIGFSLLKLINEEELSSILDEEQLDAFRRFEKLDRHRNNVPGGINLW